MTDEIKEDALSSDDRTELFLVQVRGTIATAFLYSSVAPDEKDWAVIRGNTDPTMRQLGEIGHRTGFNMHVQLHDRNVPRPASPT